MRLIVRRLIIGAMIVAGFAGLLLTTGVLGSPEVVKEEEQQRVLPPSPISAIDVKLESIEISLGARRRPVGDPLDTGNLAVKELVEYGNTRAVIHFPAGKLVLEQAVYGAVQVAVRRRKPPGTTA